MDACACVEGTTALCTTEVLEGEEGAVEAPCDTDWGSETGDAEVALEGAGLATLLGDGEVTAVFGVTDA